jgi:hypothetical protein
VFVGCGEIWRTDTRSRRETLNGAEIIAASDEFEQRIERIHRLLESEGAVKWNERISDPDNPEQLRQIDVTIRRDDKLTMVQCRIHSAPQDV